LNTYIVVYFGSALISMLLVPFVIKLAKRYNFFDTPGPRKQHHSPIPRIGGISFVAGTLALIIPVFALDNPIAESFRHTKIQFIALLAGAGFIYLIGLLDDLRSIRSSIKLLCLAVAALAFCFSGATIQTIRLGSFLTIHTGLAAYPLTVLWVVGLTVCMGLIDGLDGLAAGIAVIVCGTLVVLSLWSGQVAMAVMMLAMLGGVTGFLIFNFYPAKIFMGDGGSLFLGFMIAGSSIICQSKTSAFVGLALPFLVLGMPILDTGLVFAFRNIIERRSMFAPDSNHLHHRLMRLGLNHRSVVLVMYAITAISASIGIFMLRAKGDWSVGFLTAGIVLLFSMFACLQKGRYQKLFSGFKRNLAIARKAKKQTCSFELAEVKMRESLSFSAWWQTLCAMGENMHFQSLSLLHRDNGQDHDACVWNASQHETEKSRTVELSLPLKSSDNKDCRLKAFIYVEDYLELSGHQVKLLTRLIDEFPLPQYRIEAHTTGNLFTQNVNSKLQNEPNPVAHINEYGTDAAKTALPVHSFAVHNPLCDSPGSVSSSLRNILKQHH
jgi:UDP-GlcNAc:undecaprenyl-phosphate/decaprenyl-phosphate GlcNAc-1-phosphate transferase